MSQKVYIIGGGTFFHISPHNALAAPAHGKVANELAQYVLDDPDFHGELHLHLTKMAGDEYLAWQGPRDGNIKQIIPDPHNEDDDQSRHLDTNEDIKKLLMELVEEPSPKIIFLPAALTDFIPEAVSSSGQGDGLLTQFGKHMPRWETGQTRRDGRGNEWPAKYDITVVDAPKIINLIRKERKDIFLVGFKTTSGATPEKQFEKGLTLLKKASCNLVLANDIKTKMNMIITPENAPYEPSTDREQVLRMLVGMTIHRSQGHFTRTTVAEGKHVDWNSKTVPETLRKVVNWCVSKGAYKPFLGATVGHFAFKVEDNKFVTSRRKTNFNELDKVGMVMVESLGDDRVIAYGSRPSVGGQSQRIIFNNHPDVDCIVHFHCPLRQDATIPIREQWMHECGSHECGQNTSDGFQKFALRPTSSGKSGIIKATMLDRHGPNIAFHRNADADAIIQFIDENWDLSRSTSELF